MFRAALLSARLDGGGVDWGSYNLPVLARGTMPSDRRVLGFVSSSRGEGSFNGVRLNGPSPIVLWEGAELHYRIAPETQWTALQVDREILDRIGIDCPHGGFSVLVSQATAANRLSAEIRCVLQGLRALECGSENIVDPARYGCALRATLLASFSVAVADTARPSDGLRTC